MAAGASTAAGARGVEADCAIELQVYVDARIESVAPKVKAVRAQIVIAGIEVGG